MMKNLKGLVLLLGVVLAQSVYAEEQTYRIDNTHSFANWTIRHVVSKTSGTFSDITGKLSIDPKDLSKSSVDATINVLSVNSSHVKRDEHIQKEEYLDAKKYSQMHFVSTQVQATSATEGVITGNFSMHGVTKQIAFPFKLLGFGSDPWGGYRTGLEGHVMIKASDYGFGWATKANAPVGDDIEVTLLIEGVRYFANDLPIK
jgi:polyisoprenoid-binding protein YceI